MSDDSLKSELTEDSQRLLETAIEEHLRMSAEQRIEAHENALRLLNDRKDLGPGDGCSQNLLR